MDEYIIIDFTIAIVNVTYRNFTKVLTEHS
jgi:hypothetical protein